MNIDNEPQTADSANEALAVAEPGSAYALLSKPTLQLTEAEIEQIFLDLRKRRQHYLQGQQDNPGKKPSKVASAAVAAGKPTPEEKSARTKALMAQMGLAGVSK